MGSPRERSETKESTLACLNKTMFVQLLFGFYDWQRIKQSYRRRRQSGEKKGTCEKNGGRETMDRTRREREREKEKKGNIENENYEFRPQ